MASSKRVAQAGSTPLQRVHGRTGATYLEHLRATTRNSVLSEVLDELEREAAEDLKENRAPRSKR